MACCCRNPRDEREEREERRRNREKKMMIEDPVDRRKFIVKVLLIVGVNLLITTMFAAWATFHWPTRRILRRVWWLSFPCVAILITLHIMICYCSNLFRKKPLNYFLLSLYILAHTVLLCLVVAWYHAKLILMAFGACTVLVILLILFARFAPCDFTKCWTLIFVLVVVMIILGLIAFFVRSIRVVYVSVCVIAYSFFLVVDIQLLIGGKTHQNEYDEEDYIIAAMGIYSDIIHLFTYILSLCGIIN